MSPQRRKAERPPPLGDIAEAAWQEQVIQLAAYNGWVHYHTHDSRRSPQGWPDLVLCRPPELIFVELKTRTGRLTNAQAQWIAWLTSCGMETFVWRPADFESVAMRLQRRTT